MRMTDTRFRVLYDELVRRARRLTQTVDEPLLIWPDRMGRIHVHWEGGRGTFFSPAPKHEEEAFATALLDLLEVMIQRIPPHALDRNSRHAS